VTFSTQSSAKWFFIDKIVAQAEFEGAPLSTTEREMLAFSESDPEFVADPVALNTRLNEEETDDEYEAKVAGLIERSFQRDVEADSRLGQQWHDARAVLAQGDHYLLIMIDRGLDPSPAIAGSSVTISVLGKSALIMSGALAVLIGGLTALYAALVAVNEGFAWDQMPTFVTSILLLAAGAYLIRKARRTRTS